MKTLGAVAAAVLVTAGIMANVGAKPEQKNPQVVQFSSTQVRLAKEHLSPDRKWLKAFIPTGSDDKRVVATINGQWLPGEYVAVGAGANMNVSDVLGPGVTVWAWSQRPFPDEVLITMTVAQPGASFKKPMPFDLEKHIK